MKNLNLIPKSPLMIAFCFGEKEALAFKISPEALENNELKQKAVSEIVEAMKVRNELDKHRLIEGENVFSIKKLTPKKSFSLNVLYEGEIVTTAISGMKFPSIVLHDVDLLTKYLNTCFKFGSHGILVPLESPKVKALPKAKSPEQIRSEKIRIAERAEKIALIKAQRKAANEKVGMY